MKNWKDETLHSSLLTLSFLRLVKTKREAENRDEAERERKVAMTQFVEKRPTAVSVIGWFWIIVGGFMLLASISTVQKGPPSESLLNSMGEMSALLAAINRHYLLTAFFVFAIGDIAIISGICFLRLQAWARTALESVSWLGIVFFVGLMVVGILLIGNDVSGIIGLIGINAFYWVPLGLIIRSLRSKKVRDAVASSPRVAP